MSLAARSPPAAKTPWMGLCPDLVDAGSPTPLYHQIFLILKDLMRRGELAEGALLPGEPDLAKLFDVSRITAKRAMNDLAAAGLVTRRRGRGTAVASGAASTVVMQPFDSLVRSLEQMGADTEVELLDLSSDHAIGQVATLLDLSPASPVSRLTRLRRLDGTPFSHLTTFLPQDIASKIKVEDLASRSMLKLLAEVGAAPAAAEQWIAAVGADPRIAAALEVPAGSPLLRITRVVKAASGRRVQLIYAHYHPERFTYHLQAVGRPHEDEEG
jgi:GntR family transcriptional regulator